MSLFAELRRRNVIRMAGLYLVGAWLAVQVTTTLLPLFDAPAGVVRGVVILLAIGFTIWFFRRWRATEAGRWLGDKIILGTPVVQDLVRKRGLGKDPEVQTLEDALCLVFLETQFHDLAARLDPDKLDGVVDKTLKKMSPDAIARVADLDLSAEDRARLAH